MESQNEKVKSKKTFNFNILITKHKEYKKNPSLYSEGFLTLLLFKF